jgi:hypothetical protein
VGGRLSPTLAHAKKARTLDEPIIAASPECSDSTASAARLARLKMARPSFAVRLDAEPSLQIRGATVHEPGTGERPRLTKKPQE